jgi:RHS repeat-associated protein
MMCKQRLLTALLSLLFATVLTDQASALYDPDVGRFCSRDPIGYLGKNINLFELTISNALNSVDPTGLLFC